MVAGCAEWLVVGCEEFGVWCDAGEPVFNGFEVCGVEVGGEVGEVEGLDCCFEVFSFLERAVRDDDFLCVGA